MSELSNFHTNKVKLPWAKAPDSKCQTSAAWLCSSPKATQQRAAGTALGRHCYSYAFTESCSSGMESLALQRDLPTSHLFPGWRVHVATSTQQKNASSIFIYVFMYLFWCCGFFFSPHLISNCLSSREGGNNEDATFISCNLLQHKVSYPLTGTAQRSQNWPLHSATGSWYLMLKQAESCTKIYQQTFQCEGCAIGWKSPF